jgi:hypothetical protein
VRQQPGAALGWVGPLGHFCAAPATDVIMGALPEAELGVGCGTNDTAVELGGALGIAVLGSVLATTYKSTLGAALAGAHLPAAALSTAKDSIGGAQAEGAGAFRCGAPGR